MKQITCEGYDKKISLNINVFILTLGLSGAVIAICSNKLYCTEA